MPSIFSYRQTFCIILSIKTLFWEHYCKGENDESNFTDKAVGDMYDKYNIEG